MSVLRQQRRGPVALLTLNRPERRNALSLELLAHLKTAFAQVAAGDATVVVVTGADPAFCAGLDLHELAGSTRSLEGEGVISAMRAVPQPLIAAVNGACVTGGLELALNCDVRIASERASFADTHTRVGVHPGWGMSAILPRLVGSGWARHLSLTADYIDATTALRAGLVTRVVAHAELLAAAMSMAASIAAADQPVLRAYKRLYDEDGALLAALRRERAGFEEHRRGLDAGAVAARVDGVIAHGRSAQRGG